MPDSSPHSIQHEGTAYEGDQPVTYEVRCSCGEVFDHIAPPNAWRQWHEHVVGSLLEQLEAVREALTLIADYGHEADDYELPPKQARKIAREALNPASEPEAS